MSATHRIPGLVSLVLLAAVGRQETGRAAEPVTIHLAGEAWFLNTLTRTGLIREFERKTGVRVEVTLKTTSR